MRETPDKPFVPRTVLIGGKVHVYTFYYDNSGIQIIYPLSGCSWLLHCQENYQTY